MISGSRHVWGLISWVDHTWRWSKKFSKRALFYLCVLKIISICFDLHYFKKNNNLEAFSIRNDVVFTQYYVDWVEELYYFQDFYVTFFFMLLLYIFGFHRTHHKRMQFVSISKYAQMQQEQEEKKRETKKWWWDRLRANPALLRDFKKGLRLRIRYKAKKQKTIEFLRKYLNKYRKKKYEKKIESFVKKEKYLKKLRINKKDSQENKENLEKEENKKNES